MTLVLLVVVGFVASVVNTLAGGGGLLILPALVFAGVPADVANGTYRIGVLVQSGTALARYRKDGLPVATAPWWVWGPAVAGAIVGTLVSLDIDEAALRRVIGLVMVVMLVLVLGRPGVWLEGRTSSAPRWAQALGFFVVGMYGGFLQAGVGVLLLGAGVLLAGRDLLRANVEKVWIVGLYTIPSFLLFLADGRVLWVEGLALALGSAGGGWVGARLAVERGAGLIRGVLVAAVVVSASKMLGLW